MSDEKEKLEAVEKNIAKDDLQVIVDLLTKGDSRVSSEDVDSAINRVLNTYENQLRTYLVAAAKSKLTRIMRLMEIIDTVEDVVTSKEVIDSAKKKPWELIRIWGMAQSSLSSDLDFIKDIIKMKKDLQTDGAKTVVNILGNDVRQDAISEIPSLSPIERNKIRNLLSGIIDNVKED